MFMLIILAMIEISTPALNSLTSGGRAKPAYLQGWYPTGQATPSDIFNPSNALVKAMLVASGTAMASYKSSLGTTTVMPPVGRIR